MIFYPGISIVWIYSKGSCQNQYGKKIVIQYMYFQHSLPIVDFNWAFHLKPSEEVAGKLMC